MAKPIKNLRGFSQFVTNELATRFQLMDSLFGSQREYKIDHECGYPIDITPQLYKQYYLREGIATRVVNIFPDECWKKKPVISDTDDNKRNSPFEKAWDVLEKKHKLCSYMHRLDEFSGIGRFGIMLLGIDDGLPLDEPVEGIDDFGRGIGTNKPKRNLLYIRPFDESLVLINQFDVNPDSPRYGKPLYYSINFIDSTQWGTVSPIGAEALTMRRVHWTRVIHVAEHTSSSEIFGQPRMQKVFNRLYDLKKICGGSAEMFWKGGYPGLTLDINPDMLDVDMDQVALDKEMDAYHRGLKRYLALTGVTARSLSPSISDPTPHYNLQINFIAASIKCPVRVFTGTEQGQLAGAQDALAWAQRVEGRREDHVQPNIIDQTVDRLVGMEVLPATDTEEGHSTKWKELTSPDEQTQSQIILTKTQALAAYMQGNVDQLVPPVEYFTQFMGLEIDEAEQIVSAAEKHIGVGLDELAQDSIDKKMNPPEPMAPVGEDGKPMPNGGPNQPKQGPLQAKTRPSLASAKPAKVRPALNAYSKINEITRKAIVNQTCAAVEGFVRNDLGMYWSPLLAKGRAAKASREAIEFTVNMEAVHFAPPKIRKQAAELHRNAAHILNRLGSQTAARFHENRFNVLTKTK